MKVISINIASAAQVSLDGGKKKHKSGIFKVPISEPIFLGLSGLKGDGVGDSRIHGGSDKAVCAYYANHFSYWAEKLQRNIAPGAFGENLTLEGPLETEVSIGDIFEIGSARIQVSQPRQPCHKLNKVFNNQGMACNVGTTGFTGYYFRVIKTGLIESGAPMKLIAKEPSQFSIEKANSLLRKGGANIKHMEELISLKVLAEDWRKMIEGRLKRKKRLVHE